MDSVKPVQQFVNSISVNSNAISESLINDTGMHPLEAKCSVSKLTVFLNQLIHHWVNSKCYPQDSFHKNVYQAKGQVVIRTPVSYPLTNGAWALIPALLTGNSVSWVLPGECVSLHSVLKDLSSCMLGLENLQVMIHDSFSDKDILSLHPNLLVFIGSSFRANGLKRLSAKYSFDTILETGGINLGVALPGSSINSIVRATLAGLLRHSGQCCNAPSHLLVPTDQLQMYIHSFEQALKGVSYEDASDLLSIFSMSTQRYFRFFNKYTDDIRKISAGIVEAENGPEGLPRPIIAYAKRIQHQIEKMESIGPGMVVAGYSELEEVITAFQDQDLFSVSIFGPEASSVVNRFSFPHRTPMIGVNTYPRSSAEARWYGASVSGKGYLLTPESIFQFTNMMPI